MWQDPLNQQDIQPDNQATTPAIDPLTLLRYAEEMVLEELDDGQMEGKEDMESMIFSPVGLKKVEFDVGEQG